VLHRPVIEKVNAGLSGVLRAPDVQQRMNEMVIDTAPTSPEAFAVFIRAETDRWAKVLKDAGITQQ
jgi:tripartite-type tricarboxylate transporter receptor subunit TctC